MRGRIPVVLGLIACAISGDPPGISTFMRAAWAAERAAEPNLIGRISAQASGDKTVIVVQGSTTAVFTAYRLDQPPRLIIDIANGRLRLQPEERQLLVDTWAVGQVAADERVGDATLTAKILINLKRPSSYTVRPDGHKLVITITPHEAPPPSEEMQKAEQALRQALSEREKIASDLKRLEQRRAEIERQERDLAARLSQRAQSASDELVAERSAAQKKAEQAERELAGAQAALRQAEAARRELLGKAQRAQQLLGEQTERLRVQREEIARLSQREKAQRGQEAEELTRRRQAAEQAERQLNEQRQRTLDEIQRLERARIESTRKEAELQALSARAEGQERRLKELQGTLLSTQRQAEQAERARQSEEARLAELMKLRQQAERQVAEQQALLQAQQREVARLTELRRARRSEEEAEQQARQKRLLAEEALKKAQAQRQGIEQDLARLEQARLLRQQREQELTARLQQAEKAKDSQLETIRRELAEAHGEAEQVRRQVAAAREALQQAEVKRQQAAQAQQAEEARLVELQKARQQAEAERKALEQAQREELRRLAEVRRRTDLEIQAQEARLAELQKARRQAEAEQQKELERLAQLRKQAEEQQRELAQARKQTAAEQQKEQERLARERRQTAAEQQRELERLAQQRKQAEAEQQKELERLAQLRRQAAEQQKELERLARLRQQAAAQPAPAAAAAAAPPLPEKKAPPLPTARPEPRLAQVAMERGAERGGLIPVRDVRFEDDGRIARIVVLLGGSGVETTVYTDNYTAVLRLHGVTLPRELSRTLDASAYNGPVSAISSFPDPRVSRTVRLVVSLARPVTPTLYRHGAQLIWEFPRASVSVRSFPAARFAGFATPPVPLQVAPAGPPKAPVTAGRGRRRYEGRRIDLDFKDADIHNILRLLSDVGQVNIVTADDVKGTVTIRMRDVPWDQALDVVLKAKGLGSVREGNLIRVAPQEKLDKEAEAEAARLKAKVELQPIETRLIPLSYADATKMEKKVQDLLSPRGKITVDERTNVLIISDMAPNIALAEDLLRNLDTPIPQVLIEARIVEARASFLRQIGIQWGGDYLASTASGNPTGLSFPSMVNVAGGNVDQQTQRDRFNGLGPNAANPEYVVNLPVATGTGAGGALGIALGHVAGVANINLRLSAAETNGNIRIISAPKVTTVDNFKAIIEQGVKIPIQVVSAAGAQTQFFDAKLALEVKPRVTNDGYIGMEIQITRDEADFVNTGARGDPSILTRKATTNLLVRDGDTAVIGGIYTRQSGQAYSKVPYLAEIPILGWLFKSRRETDERNEMLIFITPRIVNRPGPQATR